MKKNNAGISLVEVIIVVAILAILTGTGLYSVSQLTGYRAREAADKVASSLAENKIATLGKAKGPGKMAWEISRDGNEYYVCTVNDAGTASEYITNKENINDGGLKSVKIGQVAGGGGSWITLSDGAAYRVYFNRGTGALCNAGGAAIGCNIVIRVTSGKKSYDVEVVSKTGKVISDTVRK